MAPVLPDAGHLDLPENIALHYMNEGAANVLYRIAVVPRARPPVAGQAPPAEGTPPCLTGSSTGLLRDEIDPMEFNNTLLRLRKNLPTTNPSAQTHEAWRRHIFPLLKGELVEQSLVKLPAGLITKLNLELESWEKYDYELKGPGQTVRTRLRSRRGVYLAEDEYGILVRDMTPTLPNQVLLEFKPKWLVQSPAAPQGAQRCRTCALNARKNALRADNGEELEPPICPLDLVSRDHRCTSHVSKQLLAKYDFHRLVVARFINYLGGSPALSKLRTYQWVFDRLGVFESDPNSDSFLKAMTLRDCSMFVQISKNPGEPLVVKLGDFDLKSPSKAAYWKSVEEPLIRDGWYMGTEPANKKQPLTCNLSTNRWEEIEKGKNVVVNTTPS